MATAQIRRVGSKKNQVIGATARKKDKAKATGTVLASLNIVPDWDQVEQLVELDFDRLTEERTKLMAEIAFREAKRKDLDEKIMSLLAVSGVEKVTWQDRPVQIVTSNSGARIKGEKLLLLGVPADTIAQATEPGREYQYLMVGKPEKG